MIVKCKSKGTNEKHVLNNGYEATLKKLFSWRLALLSFFVVVFPLQSFLWASEEKTLCEVEYTNEKLSVNVNNIALGKVLSVIQEQTGIEFVLRQEQSEQLVSVLFESIPLSQSLRRILSHYNHAIIFSTDKQPVKVIVFGDAFFDRPNQLAEKAKTSSKQILTSSFSPQNAYPKQDTKESSKFTSFSQRIDNNQSAGQNSISPNSLKTAATQPSSLEQMIITTASESMDIQPTTISMEQMTVTTASEIMDIQPTAISLEQMMITTPSEVMVVQPTPLKDMIKMPQLKE